MSAQARLLELPAVGLYPIEVVDANRLLLEWGHKLGPCERPFHSEAFALELHGAPNPMPESVRDRPTKCHEYLFLLSRSARYHYDQRAIAEPASPGSHAAADHAREGKHGTKFGRSPRRDPEFSQLGGRGLRHKQNASFSAAVADLVETRNARTVWTIPTQPFPGAHFATFPEALVARCILAGSRPGDVIFDPFMGSGTVAKVAEGLGRRFVGCELNPEYAAMYGSVRPAQLGVPL